MKRGTTPGEEHAEKAQGPLRHRVFGGFLWALTGVGVHGAVQFATVVAISRLLPPSEVGIASAVMIVVWFAQTFAQLGVGPGIVQRPVLTDRHIATGLTLAMLLGLLTGTVIFLGADRLADALRIPAAGELIRVIAFVFPIIGLSTVSESLLQRSLRFKDLVVIDTIGYVVGYGATAVLLAATGFGAWFVVGAQLMQATLRAILLVRAARHRWSLRLHRAEAAGLLSFGTAISLGKVGHFSATQGDNFIVARFLGVADLAFYSRAFQFVTLPANLLGGAIDRVMFPAMGSIQDNPARMAKAYMRAVAIAAMIMLPITSFLVVAAPELILLVLGSTWGPVVLPFQILVCSLVFRTSARLSDSLARSSGIVYQRAWRQWIYAAAVVAGAYVGRTQGLAGVSVGVVMAAVLNFALMLRLSVSWLGIPWPVVSQVYLRHLAIGIGVSSAAAGAATVARRSDVPDIVTLIVTAVSAGLSWLVLRRVFPRLFGDDLDWAVDLVRQHLARPRRQR